MQERTFNPKKHKDQRRKRKAAKVPAVRYMEVKRKSQAGVEYSHFEQLIPVVYGKNRHAYRVELAKNRKEA